MDIPQNNASQNNFPGVPSRNSGHFWKMVVLFLIILVMAIGVYLLWEAFYSSDAKEARDQAANYAQYQKGTVAYEEAMRNDTYGGKTPEETLQLFTDALKKGDVELASKYFELDQNANSPTYMTRKVWEDALKKIDSERLREIVIELSTAESAGSSVKDYWGFEVKNSQAEVVHDVSMHLNRFSGVWKIENF